MCCEHCRFAVVSVTAGDRQESAFIVGALGNSVPHDFSSIVDVACHSQVQGGSLWNKRVEVSHRAVFPQEDWAVAVLIARSAHHLPLVVNAGGRTCKLTRKA